MAIEYLWKDRRRSLGLPLSFTRYMLSELDARRQEFVLNRITDGQVFITCCEEGALSRLKDGKVFHVCGGQLQ